MFDTAEITHREAGAPAAAAQALAGPITMDKISEGMARGLTKTVTERDVEMFGDVTGDRNPVHFDEEYASGTMFGGRIAHGMLTGALISAVIGEQLPGHGTIYLKQSLTFLAPVRIGDVVEVTVTVASIDRERNRAVLDCVCAVGDTKVLKGEALVLVPTAGD